MRILLLVVAFVLEITGCASWKDPQSVQRLDARAVEADSIDRLVQELRGSFGLWRNGLCPILELEETASTDEVLSEIFQKTGFDEGRVTTHRIIESRTVQIDSQDPPHTAVLLDTNLGRKIVLFQHPPGGGWWSRVYKEGR